MLEIHETFQQALELYDTGRKDEARRLCDQIVGVSANHADAWHLLGLIAHETGRHQSAMECVQRAINLHGANPAHYNTLGLCLAAQNEVKQAAEKFRLATMLAPTFAEPHANLGCALRNLGDWEKAKACLNRALALNPDFAAARFTLAQIHRSLGLLEEAEADLRDVLRIDPRFPGARTALAGVRRVLGLPVDEARDDLDASPTDSPESRVDRTHACLMAGCIARALEESRQALTARPGFPMALSAQGMALWLLGQSGEAEASLRAAVQTAPGLLDARHQLGIVMLDNHCAAEACDSFQQLLRIAPKRAETHVALVRALLALGRYDEADRAWRTAVDECPGRADMFCQLAALLADQGRMSEAEALMQRAVEQDPSPRVRLAHATLLPPILGSTAELERRRQALARNLDALAEDGVRVEASAESLPLLFYLAHHGRNDRAIHCQYARLIAPADLPAGMRVAAHRAVADSTGSVDEPGTPLNPPFARGEEDALMLGQTASGDSTGPTPDRGTPLDPPFARGEEDASVGGLTRPGTLFEPPFARKKLRVGFFSTRFRDHTIGRLNQGLIARLPRERLDVIALTDVPHGDVLARFIADCADEYVVVSRDTRAARAAIAAAEVDVLVYTDLGMDSLTHALACSRLAPIQCLTWGHPATSGLETIDYFLSSELLEIPEAQEHYSERLIRLAALPVYYYRPTPPPPKDRRALGLPMSGNLYACPQTLFKIHPDFDQLLGEILRRDPQGCLILLEGQHPNWRELLIERFERVIPDVFDRIVFLPPLKFEDFLALNAAVDVLLDPIHFGGGNTSYEAFSVGTPVVTLPSLYLKGRITQALYRLMGVSSCIAQTAQEYVAIATRLGTDRAWRDNVCKSILSSSHRIFEDESGLRELESFFLSTAPVAERRAS